MISKVFASFTSRRANVLRVGVKIPPVILKSHISSDILVRCLSAATFDNNKGQNSITTNVVDAQSKILKVPEGTHEKWITRRGTISHGNTTNAELNKLKSKIAKVERELESVIDALRQFPTADNWEAARSSAANNTFVGLFYMDWDELRAEKVQLRKKEEQLRAEWLQILPNKAVPVATDDVSWEERELSDSVQSAINQYTAIGCELRDDKIVQAAKRDILQIAHTQLPPEEFDFPFIVIDAPSGSGKTQFPFALKAAGLNIEHLVLDKKFGQTIYKAFGPISDAFGQAVKDDVNKLNPHSPSDPFFSSDDLSCRQLVSCTARLRIVRFVVAVLRKQNLCNKVEARNINTVKDLRAHIAQLKKKGQGAAALPILVLDEAISKSDDGKATLRLARNVLRAAGLVAIMMGTNSCAYNLVSAASGSRESEKPILPLWCQLITRLPRLTNKTQELIGVDRALLQLKGHDALVALVRENAKSCLPYFLEVLARVVNGWEPSHIAGFEHTADLMNELFADMLDKVRNEKGQLYSLDGLRGQLALQCSAYQADAFDGKKIGKQLSELAKNTDVFVASHFARLVDENPKLYLGSQQKLVVSANKNGAEWQRNARFLSPKDDFFLHLLFLGSHNVWTSSGAERQPFTPFMLSHKVHLPARDAFVVVDSDARLHDKIIQRFNPNALSRDGDDLEALVAVAMGSASRTNGFCGVELVRFLQCLCAELSVGCQDLSSLSQAPPCQRLSWKKSFAEGQSVAFTKHFGRMYVPYMSAPNVAWPVALSEIPSSRFAELTRPPNAQRMDLTVRDIAAYPNTLKISGECKNLKDPLDLDRFKGIVKRIPMNEGTKTSRRVQIIFTTRTQQSYFTENETAWGAFYNEHLSHTNANVAKLVVSNNTLDLVRLSENMRWRPWKQCKLLVVVIPIEELPDL